LTNIRFFTHLSYILELFKRGIKRASTPSKWSLLWPLSLWASIAITFYVFLSLSAENVFAANLFGAIALPLSITVATVATALTIIGVGTPPNAFRINGQIRQAGLKNSIGESPLIISETLVPEKPGMKKLVFISLGVCPLDVEALKPNLEAAIGRKIVKVEMANSLKHLCLYTMPANEELPDVLPWDDAHLSEDNFVLTLGKSLLGIVRIDFSNIPHWLIGGATNSGKSCLFRLVLMQALRKQAIILLGDFKGGVDFTADIWRSGQCTLITNRKRFLLHLREFMHILQERTEMLEKARCKNLDEYNRKFGLAHPRLIVAVDEVAVLLQRGKRMDKEDKTDIDEIEQILITIGQIGRSCNVSLILSLQRPDANVIDGSLKCNLTGRISGRCDKVLSQIILDQSDAAAQIPDDRQGMFMLHDSTVFLAFFWQDEDEVRSLSAS